MVYVADGMPQAFVIPYERAIYKHSIVQAWEGGYLIPWKPRDDLLRFRIGLKPDTFRSAQLEMMFDRVLNFNDLWNYFEFQIANLNWTLFLLNHMFAARVSYHDDEVDARSGSTLTLAPMTLRPKLRMIGSSFRTTCFGVLLSNQPKT